jgi:hypothetical protein
MQARYDILYVNSYSARGVPSKMSIWSNVLEIFPRAITSPSLPRPLVARLVPCVLHRPARKASYLVR